MSRLSAFAAEKNRPDAVAKSDAFVNALVDLLHGKGKAGLTFPFESSFLSHNPIFS